MTSVETEPSDTSPEVALTGSDLLKKRKNIEKILKNLLQKRERCGIIPLLRYECKILGRSAACSHERPVFKGGLKNEFD